MKQEKRTAKEFGEVRDKSLTQIASGALPSMKGDAKTGEKSIGFNSDDFLIENKFTDADKYKLDLATWNKISEEALRDNMRIPVMQIDIKNDVSLVVLSLFDIIALGGKKYWKEAEDIRFIEAKSYTMKHEFYHSSISVDDEFFQRLHFYKQHLDLVVVDKDEFLRFLAQNIEN